jgi:glycosyltransferase involved in cell wall biosynthesis
MDEKVSVIIPVYNNGSQLSRCIDSCLAQTYCDLEIIIVNDGSTDNSESIALSYKEKDSRVKVVTKQNEGLPLARRRGFDESSGAFIFHLDSDDYIETDAIEILLKRMRKEDAEMAIGGTLYEKKDGSRMTTWISMIEEHSQTGYLKGIFRSEIQPNIWGRLIKRKVFEPVNVPRQYNCGEDYLANIMMICFNKDLKIVSEESLLYHYVVYGSSLTNTWPAEVFMPYTDEIARILTSGGLEELVMNDWAWFRVIKAWRYYLRRGGKIYLKDRLFLKEFYSKYYKQIRHRLSILERFELNLYRYNKNAGFLYSRIYQKANQLIRRK